MVDGNTMFELDFGKKFYEMSRLRMGQCAGKPLVSRDDMQVEHSSQQTRTRRWLF